jgi:thiamine biosynthesis lipoprotein
MSHPSSPVVLASRMRLAMGTFASVRVSGHSESGNEAALSAAFNVIDWLENSLHPHRLGSDIAAINSAGRGSAIPVGDETLTVLKIAAEVFAASEGRFDPCLPTCEGRFASLELVATTVIVHEGVHLDLGGIAKGFAVDTAIALVNEHGCLSGSVNIGGEVAAFGAPETISLRRADGSLSTFELDNEAVAITDVNSTSGPSEHRGYYQRDANRGRVRDYAAIAAPSAAIADALTKCALYCSDEELKPILDHFRARLV